MAHTFASGFDYFVSCVVLHILYCAAFNDTVSYVIGSCVWLRFFVIYVRLFHILLYFTKTYYDAQVHNLFFLFSFKINSPCVKHLEAKKL
jgi:hypothetical protein